VISCKVNVLFYRTLKNNLLNPNNADIDLE